MARKRELRGRPEANALAAFVCRITDPRTVDEVRALCPSGPARSTWAKYMNGTEVIPKQLLGSLITSLFAEKPALLGAHTTEGAERWKAAHAESLRPAEPEQGAAAGAGGSVQLLRVQGELIEALKGQHRAVQAADKANAMISSLLQMGALLDTVIASKETQLRSVVDRERAEVELQLSQARLRLERTSAELEKAKSRRYTAEQAQQAMTREVMEAREQVARLQQRMEAVDTAGLPVVAQLPPVPEILLEDFDNTLADLIEEGAEADQEIAELAVQAHLTNENLAAAVGPTILEGTVIASSVPDQRQHVEDPVLSKTITDNNATSNERAEQTPAASEPEGRDTRVVDNGRQAAVSDIHPGYSQANPLYSEARPRSDGSGRPANTASFQDTAASLVEDLDKVQDLAGFAQQLRVLRIRAGTQNWPLEKIARAVFPDADVPDFEDFPSWIAYWLSGRGMPPKEYMGTLVRAMGATVAEVEAFELAQIRVGHRAGKEEAARPAPSPETPAHVGSPSAPEPGRPLGWPLPARLRITMLMPLAFMTVIASMITASARTEGPTWGNFWVGVVVMAIAGPVAAVRGKDPTTRRLRAGMTLAVLAGIILPVLLNADIFGGYWITKHLSGLK
ncbi:hypothetical protein ACIPUC_14535 [Streptomyces sp. LARHCF249]